MRIVAQVCFAHSPREVVVISASATPSRGGTAPGIDTLLAAISEPRTFGRLASWISTQRWYSGKGRTIRARIVGGYELIDPTGEASIYVVLVLDEAAPARLYQVPLTARRTASGSVPVAPLAEYADTRGEPVYLFDGPHDPAFARALLQLILSEADTSTHGTPATEPAVYARGHRALTGTDGDIVTSRVLGGEQSNTSIVYEMKDADGAPARPVICKLFRTLHHGDNPEVTLLEALGTAGSLIVPRPVGHVTGRWSDTGREDGTATGDLASAQEFLPGVEDAWRVALAAAEENRDFSIAARALGEAVAETHKTLARTLGASHSTEAGIRDSMESMRHRLDLAVAEVPELAEWRRPIESAYERAAAARWPKLQRIHGDLHLGQVLAVPGRGWVLLDFEGEPLRPMSERNRPDSPLRDVAGMLRSFDYVAGAVALTHPGASATKWSLACRRAFVGGYSARTGHNLREDRTLLDAFEIDKAIYEAVYEARNRPDWLPIPVAAITRLAERARAL
jgi:predicted trehalose synthase